MGLISGREGHIHMHYSMIVYSIIGVVSQYNDTLHHLHWMRAVGCIGAYPTVLYIVPFSTIGCYTGL